MTNISVVIRRATKDDAQVIGSFGPDFDKMNEDNISGYNACTLEEGIKVTEKDFEQTSACHFVAEVDGKIVGYTICFRFPEIDSYYIDELYVLPEYRGNHIARKLIQEIEKVAKTESYTVKLEVYEWNIGAIEFYKKCGFKNEGFVFEKEV